MRVYYNEIDPFLVDWLKELMIQGSIPKGDVDDRSITEIPSSDLTGYEQIHFFAGIGVWAYALEQAGWGDRPVWTGSCPCQPFSSAGKRLGNKDDRDLWWAMYWHIQQQKPPVIFGEQVGRKPGLGWWDIVSHDLEADDYACTAFDLAAASVGAPHIRQRLFWVAENANARCNRSQERSLCREKKQPMSSKRGRLVYTNSKVMETDDITEAEKVWPEKERRSGTSGFWSDSEWLPFSDGTQRPIKPGLAPLVNGAAGELVFGCNSSIYQERRSESCSQQEKLPTTQVDVVLKTLKHRLKAYGNAIVAPLAVVFINAYLETGEKQ